MSSSNAVSTQVVNFSTFHPTIEQAIIDNSINCIKFPTHKDIPLLVSMFQTYLIRQVGCFQLRGYCRDGELGNWFEREYLSQDFDDLYLEFRDYLRTTYGFNLDSNYVMVRYRDQNTFIVFEGELNEPALLGERCSFMDDCEPLPIESDPFL
jgi:hypothetical protein